jgi:uncharacterized protein (TIGR03086 family)
MDATTAMQETNEVVTRLIAGLSSDDREKSTPCDEWNVHQLIEHMCGGAHMIAGAMLSEIPPEQMPDLLADGPAAGWSAAAAHLAASVTPANLAATHELPFGPTPGAMAVAVISADHLTHAWDLAKATGQDPQISDELAAFALGAWQPVVPAGERPVGGGFKTEVTVAGGASALDQLVAYTGRQP